MAQVLEINFGIQKAASYSFGTAYINTVMRLNKYEHIVTTSKDILRIENGSVKSRYPCPVSAAIYCKEYDALIVVSPTHSEFTVFFPSLSMKEPVFQGMELDQVGVYHILFDQRTATIITIGQGVKTWYLQCLPKKERRTLFDNRMTIIPRAAFGISYSASMITVPCYDEKKGLIYLPTSTGLQVFNLDGEVQPQPIKFPGEVLSMFAVNPFNGKMLSSDRDETKQDRLSKYRPPESHEGICYWSKKGVLRSRIPFTNSSLFAAFFVDKEFVVGLDAALFVHVVDLKTLRFYPMFQLSARPTRVFFEIFQDQPRLYVVTNNELSVYNVRVPWKMWYKAPTAPVKMARCPRYRHAARILMQLSDSSFHFVQPVTGELLTACHSRNLARPVNYYADRGIPGVSDRDQLFVVFDSGTVEMYAAHENPCKPSSSTDMKAMACCACNIFDTDAILFSTKIGDIMVYKYQGMQLIKRIQVCQDRILFLHAFQSAGVIIAVICNKFYMISMKDGSTMKEIRQDSSDVTAFFHDIFAVGYDNGALSIRRVNEDSTELLHNPKSIEHQGKVTAISAGSCFFVTTGEDGSVMVWNLNAERLAILRFPTRIFSCCVQNGFRNILLGTEAAVMIVEGSLVFGKEIDPEDVDMDNYDRLPDKLCFNLEFFRTKAAELQGKLPAEEPPPEENKEKEENVAPVQVKEPKGQPTKKNRFAELLKANRELRAQRMGASGGTSGVGAGGPLSSGNPNNANDEEARKKEIVRRMSLETDREPDLATGSRSAKRDEENDELTDEIIEEYEDESDTNGVDSNPGTKQQEQVKTENIQKSSARTSPRGNSPAKNAQESSQQKKEAKDGKKTKETKPAKENSGDAKEKKVEESTKSTKGKKSSGGKTGEKKQTSEQDQSDVKEQSSTEKSKTKGNNESKEPRRRRAATESPAKRMAADVLEEASTISPRGERDGYTSANTSNRASALDNDEADESRHATTPRSEKSSARQSARTGSQRAETMVDEHMQEIGAKKKNKKTKGKRDHEQSRKTRGTHPRNEENDSNSPRTTSEQDVDHAYSKDDKTYKQSRRPEIHDNEEHGTGTSKKSKRGRILSKSIDMKHSPSKLPPLQGERELHRSGSQDSLHAVKDRQDIRLSSVDIPHRKMKPPTYDYLGTSGRNRTAYEYQKETINPDIDLRNATRPPALFFDMSALSGTIGDENMDKYQNLSCFLQIPDSAKLTQGRAKHFCLTSPKKVEGWQSGTQTEMNSTIQMFQLDKDPPPLQEEPEFVNKPKDITTRLPPLMLDVLYRNRETTDCESRPMSYRMASARMKESKPNVSFPYRDLTCFSGRSIHRSKTPVRIINPGQSKQNMRHLDAIFKNVKRK